MNRIHFFPHEKSRIHSLIHLGYLFANKAKENQLFSIKIKVKINILIKYVTKNLWSNKIMYGVIVNWKEWVKW